MKYIIVIFSFFIVSCTSNKSKQPKKTNVLKIDHSFSPMKVSVAAVVDERDSMERAYDEGRYYFKDIVRLQRNSNTFIEIDSDYVVASIKSSAIRQLYFKTDVLSPNGREYFYQKIVAALPKREIKIFERVAAIPEVRRQAEGSDGGLYTLILWLVDRPGKEGPYYSVEIKRVYYWRLGTCVPIGFLKVNAANHKILVMDTEGNYLSLASWRKSVTRH